MKRLLFLLALALPVALMAQPQVTFSIDNVTGTEVTVSFTKNADCSRYGILLCEESDIPLGIMFGAGTNELEVVTAWAKYCYSDTTYTWNDYVPNTEYNLYVLACGADTNILTVTPVRTLSLGTSDPSVISIEVSEITSNTARVICTPNQATMLFKDMLITEEGFNELPMDTILAYLLESPYVMYATDDWVWPDLESDTRFLALAMGMNADSVWGDLTQVAFATLPAGSNGVEETETPSISFYPNPTTDLVFVEGENISKIEILDLIGRSMITSGNNNSIDLSTLTEGTYLLRVTLPNKVVVRKISKR